MRSVPPRELVEAITALLEAQILPAVDERSARATLLLAVGMLDNLAGRIEERHDLVELDTRAAHRLIDALPPGLRPAAATADSGFRDLSAALTVVLRELAARPALVEDPEVGEWLRLCGDELRRRNAEEMALVRPTRYLRSQSA